jgi:hypothetical protein
VLSFMLDYSKFFVGPIGDPYRSRIQTALGSFHFHASLSTGPEDVTPPNFCVSIYSVVVRM